MRLFLLPLFLSSIFAMANTPTPAVIESWWHPSLYVNKVSKIEVIDKTIRKIGPSSTFLSRANLRFTVDVLPHGCNTNFLKAEITGMFTRDPDFQINLTRRIQIGDLIKSLNPEVASPCPGVPARQVSFQLPLVNGYSSEADKDAVYTYLVPAENSSSGAADWLSVKIRVNQVKEEVELLEPSGVNFQK